MDVELTREFTSLSGTFVNCAGAPTPWGSWLTCEETTAGTNAGFGQKHGYVFEVPAGANGPVDPVPLVAMGRMVHEAVAIDPGTGFVYETEDRGFSPGSGRGIGSGFYRFLPSERGNLRRGGRLQALAVADQPEYDTTTGQRVGLILPVRWVDIEDVDPAGAESNPGAVFRQGRARGAAIFQRLEGCWWGDGSVYFNATSGGDAGQGQVWQYRPRGSHRRQAGHEVAGTLSLVFESPSADVLESPDNITVSPPGGVVLCEDGDGVQFVRGLTRKGEIFDLVQTNGESTEFAGACFSRDGDVLFFNTQGSTSVNGSAVGHTFALFGPWEEGALG